ncbi:MAG: APC family permease [Candidatus Eremiobacteraeota bacterium]|nr:APC family permease [Candidatus Eremiobacteraeota bacterium]MBV8498679.1 APC family permease [Candidatus Eremiobacteraeota bacterium]
MELRRTLGLFDVALFFLVACSNLQWVATAAASGPSAVTIWIIGALAMFAPLSIAVVFLSSRHPDEGGLYVWSKRAFGPFAGFLTGWTYWASTLPYFPALLYFAAGNAAFAAGSRTAALTSAPAYFIAFALAGLALATIVNVYGLAIGKWLSNSGGIARWSITLLLIALGAAAWWRFGSTTPITTETLRPGLQLKDLIFWSVIAFAWTGPESVPFMGGEIRNPRRTIPLGLALAAPAVALIYIAGTVSVLTAVLPQNVDPASGVMQAIGQIASRFGWNALTPIAALLVGLSCLGSAGAWSGAIARIPFVAGIDDYLPPVFGRMHPRWGSPVAALITQAVISAILIFLGQSGTSVKGAYTVLVSSTVITTLIPFVFLFGSALKMHAEPETPSTVRIWGGKWTVLAAALVGMVTTLIAIVFAGFPADDDPNKLLAVAKVIGLTAAVLMSGTAIYLIGRRKAAERRSHTLSHS